MPLRELLAEAKADEDAAIEDGDHLRPSLYSQVLTSLQACVRGVFERFDGKPLLLCPMPDEFELFGLDFLVVTTPSHSPSPTPSKGGPETDGGDADVLVHAHPGPAVNVRVVVLEVNGGPEMGMYEAHVRERI